MEAKKDKSREIRFFYYNFDKSTPIIELQMCPFKLNGHLLNLNLYNIEMTPVEDPSDESWMYTDSKDVRFKITKK